MGGGLSRLATDSRRLQCRAGQRADRRTAQVIPTAAAEEEDSCSFPLQSATCHLIKSKGDSRFALTI